MLQALQQHFIELFGTSPLLYRSPGRINIIGEHTDYNGGFVLPAAIEQAAYIAISKRSDNQLHLHAMSLNESIILSIDSLEPIPHAWSNYIAGVADQFIKNYKLIGGFNLVLNSNIPIGAGLSSSAAIECVVAYALNELFDCKMDRLALAHLAQKAEHQFAGVQCGLMDQFASMMGAQDQLIKLDCQSLQYEYIPFNIHNYTLVLFDTNVKHSLATSAYNERRQQCEQAVEWISQSVPLIQSLRQVNMPMLAEYVLPNNELIYKRCSYVVNEIQRVESACTALKNGDLLKLGKLMFETHQGLSADYEVSCKELDVLVETVKNIPDVIGARMMGGGFGGCTLNLIKTEAVEKTIHSVQQVYAKTIQASLPTYIVETANGTSRIA
jgi:galactokinase